MLLAFNVSACIMVSHGSHKGASVPSMSGTDGRPPHEITMFSAVTNSVPPDANAILTVLEVANEATPFLRSMPALLQLFVNMVLRPEMYLSRRFL